MEFVQNEDEVMEFIIPEIAENTVAFSRSLKEISELLPNGKKLIYIQMPTRNDGSVPDELVSTTRYYNAIKEELGGEEKIDIIEENDIKDYFEQPFERSEFYFRTDVHPSTEGELAMANVLIDLIKKTGIEIQNIKKEDYNFHPHKFEGNLTRTLGKYYSSPDIFEEFIPLNDADTNFEIKDLISDTVLKNGKFSVSVMNGLSESPENKNPYWIIDYMLYGQYIYEVQNLTINKNAAKIMVICDSYCYRTLAFLSMQCSSITVVDPRFINDDGNKVRDLIKENEYDAYICLHGTTMPPVIQ